MPVQIAKRKTEKTSLSLIWFIIRFRLNL